MGPVLLWTTELPPLGARGGGGVFGGHLARKHSLLIAICSWWPGTRATGGDTQNGLERQIGRLAHRHRPCRHPRGTGHPGVRHGSKRGDRSAALAAWRVGAGGEASESPEAYHGAANTARPNLVTLALLGSKQSTTPQASPVVPAARRVARQVTKDSRV